jgi:transcriptional regulator with XRE-family HTH domain
MRTPTRLRLARQAKGMSQLELCAAVGGMSQPYLSSLERSGRRPARSAFPERLAAVLDVPIAELFPGSINRPNAR